MEVRILRWILASSCWRHVIDIVLDPWRRYRGSLLDSKLLLLLKLGYCSDISATAQVMAYHPCRGCDGQLWSLPVLTTFRTLIPCVGFPHGRGFCM